MSCTVKGTLFSPCSFWKCEKRFFFVRKQKEVLQNYSPCSVYMNKLWSTGYSVKVRQQRRWGCLITHRKLWWGLPGLSCSFAKRAQKKTRSFVSPRVLVSRAHASEVTERVPVCKTPWSQRKNDNENVEWTKIVTFWATHILWLFRWGANHFRKRWAK